MLTSSGLLLRRRSVSLLRAKTYLQREGGVIELACGEACEGGSMRIAPFLETASLANPEGADADHGDCGTQVE